jgi:lipopolysaccharide export LptBFGC system permease protein LptF
MMGQSLTEYVLVCFLVFFILTVKISNNKNVLDLLRASFVENSQSFLDVLSLPE